MTNSTIGPKETSVLVLRLSGYNIEDDISAVSVGIKANGTVDIPNGKQWRVVRVSTGYGSKTGFEQESLSPQNGGVLNNYVRSPEFKQWHNEVYDVDPGKAYSARSAVDILTEAKAHADWAEIEAAMLVDGADLRDLAPRYGIKIYEAA